MRPSLARIKCAISKSVDFNGGQWGGAATVGLRRSVVQEWASINNPSFPRLDYVFALEEVAVAGGHLPPVICAMARELGGVFVPAIDVGADEGSPAFLAMQLAHTLGKVSGEIAISLADDNKIDAREAARVLDRLQEHDRCSAQLRQQLEKIVKEGE